MKNTDELGQCAMHYNQGGRFSERCPEKATTRRVSRTIRASIISLCDECAAGFDERRGRRKVREPVT